MNLQTVSSTSAQNNFGAILEHALSSGTTIIARYSRPLAVLIGYREYEHLKSIEAAFWTESQRIADKNDAEGTWVDGDVVEKRMRALRELEG